MQAMTRNGCTIHDRQVCLCFWQIANSSLSWYGTQDLQAALPAGVTLRVLAQNTALPLRQVTCMEGAGLGPEPLYILDLSPKVRY
jgi:hypothetical protein